MREAARAECVKLVQGAPMVSPAWRSTPILGAALLDCACEQLLWDVLG